LNSTCAYKDISGFWIFIEAVERWKVLLPMVSMTGSRLKYQLPPEREGGRKPSCVMVPMAEGPVDLPKVPVVSPILFTPCVAGGSRSEMQPQGSCGLSLTSLLSTPSTKGKMLCSSR